MLFRSSKRRVASDLFNVLHDYGGEIMGMVDIPRDEAIAVIQIPVKSISNWSLEELNK